MDKQDNKQEENQQTSNALGEDLDFTKPDFTFVPKKAHGWKQQGCYLVCRTCDLEHAMYIGMGKLLKGYDEQGQPILAKRV